MNVEKVHRYPRYFTITVEILSAITVVLALALLGRDLLRLLWSIYDLDTALFARLPWLTDLVLIISDANTPPPAGLMDLAPALAWLALALAAALFLRNSLPAVRTSAPRHTGGVRQRLAAGAVGKYSRDQGDRGG